jgi:predicted dehydrogenase
MADQIRWAGSGESDIAACAVDRARASRNGYAVALASRDADRAQETARSLGIDRSSSLIPGIGSRVAETLGILAKDDGRQGEEHFGPLDQYRPMAEALDAVLNGKPVPFTTSDSVLNLGVLDAVAHSARNGAAEEV